MASLGLGRARCVAAAPWAGWPSDRAAAAKISTAMDTLVGTNEALAASSPADSGGHGRARAAAMLPERQRHAGIGGWDPGWCCADDPSRPRPGTARNGSLQHLVTKRGRHAGGQRTRSRPIERGLRLDADHDAGRPDLGILCARGPGGRGTAGYILGLTAVGQVSRGSPGGRWIGTGGGAWTWSWTRSAGSAPG
jgi:hypothetical protein